MVDGSRFSTIYKTQVENLPPCGKECAHIPPMASITAYLTHLLAQSQATFQHWGAIGVLIYAAGILLLGVAILPLSPFAIYAGATFGFWGGFIAITIGTNAGAAFNFLVSRYIARKTISRRLANHEKFRLIDAAVGREGGKIIALLRLCPLPFGLANYCYGLTAIRFWPYFIATFFAIIPANCFFVWLGSSTHAFVEGTQAKHPGEKILLVIGLVAGFCALSYITRLAKAAVEKVEKAEEPAPEPAQAP
jgi:uncharacterized membrane protein YdjX (TVP38/TMEM64 family)